jgi:hypothetical protein
LDPLDEADDPFEARLDEDAHVFCPYCGEGVDIVVDLGGGGVQEYVEDCEVCCRPWAVRVTLDAGGVPQVSLSTLDDE